MRFRDINPVIVVAVCMTVCFCVFMMRGCALEQIKETTKQTEIHEREETERTEEDAQFWQKLVPWGSDEEEEAK